MYLQMVGKMLFVFSYNHPLMCFSLQKIGWIHQMFVQIMARAMTYDNVHLNLMRS